MSAPPSGGVAHEPRAEPGVGIVVVSHSRALADAAVALAREMAPPESVRIEVAAGVDDGFGTDATAIADAIVAVDGPQGVLVLMDLGSAVLSAELALELVDPEAAARTTLCSAPLVEGLVVAAVAAAGGASRSDLAREAQDALAGKRSQLGDVDAEMAVADDAGPSQSRDGAHQATGTFVVTTPHGLHARPAAKVVSAVRGLDADVRLRNRTTGAGPVSAASLSRVATLGALTGHEIEIDASGPDAAAAVAALIELAGAGFGEDAAADGAVVGVPAPGSQASAPAASAPHTPILVGAPVAAARPTGASPGIAIGAARAARPAAPADLDEHAAGQPAAERDALEAAHAVVRTEIEAARDAVASRGAVAEAEIFEAHLALLDDPEMLADAHARIDAGSTAAAAWHGASSAAADALRTLDDPYLQARAADIDAVRDQVVGRVLGSAEASTIDVDGVLVASDLTPAQAAVLDPERVVGVLLAGGSPTAHSSILLRSLGIPAVVGVGDAALAVGDGTIVALDGTTGAVAIDPEDAVLVAWRERAASVSAQRARDRTQAAEPARTSDGVDVLVAANAGSAEDVARAVANGADAIGLVRTEFLFLDRDTAPTLSEQVAAYRAIIDAADGRRVTLRTLDVGGDKPLPYLRQPPEANPFLGVRGIRLALANDVLLRDQLTAVLTVARSAPVSVMFPMVATVDEFRRARAILTEVAGEDGLPADLHVGVMVEVPALALRAESMAAEVDFFSIGTNDLTQYALAAERGNPAVADVADGLDPGVLQLIGAVCRGAAAGAGDGREVLVAVCGELASDPVAGALLVGLGVRELSVAGPAVPTVKATVRGTDTVTAAAAAARACAAESAAVVRAAAGS